MNELSDVTMESEYALRGSGLLAQVRHPLMDMWGVDEMFRQRVYDPPEPVVRVLATLDRPIRVADLGGHVGYFGLFVRSLFPEAEVTSFEPDPDNGRLLARCIEANGLQHRWRLVPTCAATEPGTVDFASSGHLSRVDPDADGALVELQERIGGVFPFMQDTPLLTPTRVRVTRSDVFPTLAEADLVKIDIEGGEWELLADPRFASLRAAALVFEFHPDYGPGDESERVLGEALSNAGYELGTPQRGGDAGMAWAWRRPTPEGSIG